MSDRPSLSPRRLWFRLKLLQALFVMSSKSAPDDVDAMTTVTSFASSTRASSGRVVTDAGTTTPERTPASPPEQVAGLAERRSKRSAVVRLASAPLLDVDDEPLSP